ncbi:MAG: hypothetical protein D6773_14890, partial [Alphaproteobacteria bacterium]
MRNETFDAPGAENFHVRRFWTHVPDEVAARLDDADRAVIADAVASTFQSSTPMNVRLSFGKFFLTVFAGREKRGRARLQHERKANPVLTRANLPVLVLMWGSMVLASYLLVGWAVR